jgi:hypothetical protein
VKEREAWKERRSKECEYRCFGKEKQQKKYKMKKERKKKVGRS